MSESPGLSRYGRFGIFLIIDYGPTFLLCKADPTCATPAPNFK